MRKKSVYTSLSAILFVFLFLLVSCGASYTDTFSPNDLVTQAMTSVDGIAPGEFTKLSDSYVSVFMGVDTSAIASCVMHTVSSAQYDEFGVFKCSSEADAKELLVTINRYLETSKQENVPIAQSYAPNEVPKLENAQAKQFGCYVTYAVLDDAQSQAWFAAVRELLTK